MTLDVLNRRGRADGVVAEDLTRDRFRGDIEGLRAVAVMLVLLFHAGLDVPGGFVGVDVFFVISGFLITSLLLKELRETGGISLVGFYGRRAKRLLPATAAMLTATAILTYFFLPKLRWADVAYDTIGSALYVQNWRLAQLAVDYNAQDQAPSPLQHFWSLAVEEQFYLIWPLLLLIVTLWARPRRSEGHNGPNLLRGRGRRRGRSLVPSLLLGLAVVSVPSLAWSVHMTASSPNAAYFVTTTRLWELAIGGGVAIFSRQLTSLPRAVAIALGWVGVAAVIISAFVITTATPFPGSAALGPTLGTAAVIASGVAAGRFGPALILGVPPMRWVGKLSYSLYLWHWPLLIVAATQLGPLTAWEGAGVVLATFVPAYLSLRFVEDPARRSDLLSREPLRALRLGFLCTVAGAAAGVVLLFGVWPPPAPFNPITVSVEAPGQQADKLIGAQVLAKKPRGDRDGAPVDKVSSIVPDPSQAKEDSLGETCSAELSDGDVIVCPYGDLEGQADVALIGDSHARQWLGPVDAIGRERGWRISTYLKGNCPLADAQFSIGKEDKAPYTACTAWSASVQEALTKKQPPDLAIVSGVDQPIILNGSPLSFAQSLPVLAAGYERTWQQLIDNGTQVAVIADTPRPGILVPECVSEHLQKLTACAVARDRAMQSGLALELAASQMPEVTYIDLGDAICPTKMCAPVIGGVLVYRDSNHLTGTYAGTLAPRLNAALPKVGS